MSEFVSERDDPRFAEFRAHYPLCPDCSTEVARWAELDALLLEAAPEGAHGHPDEARLLAYAQSDSSLGAAERASLDAHLSGCGSCRSELKVLQNFDFAALVPVASEEPRQATPPLLERAREQLLVVAEAIFGGVPKPVWAPVAIGLVVGVLVLVDVEEEGPVQLAQEPVPAAATGLHESETLQAPVVVAEATPKAPASPVVGSEASGETGLRLEPVTPKVAEPLPVAEVLVAVTEESALQPVEVVEVAVAEPSVDASEADTQPAGAGLLELDLDAGFPERPITYQVAALSPAMSRSLRMGGMVRAARGPEVRLQALGPDHLGSTSVASPTLYWWLSEPSEASIEITLSDEDSIEPALEITLPGPHAAGIHGLSLAEAGVELGVGEVYRWQVSLVVDPQRRSADLRSSVALAYRLPDTEVTQRLEGGPSGDRAHRYAELGYWFDSFALLSAALSESPDEAHLQAAQAALLEQVGLDEVSGDAIP